MRLIGCCFRVISRALACLPGCRMKTLVGDAVLYRFQRSQLAQKVVFTSHPLRSPPDTSLHTATLGMRWEGQARW